MIARVIEADAPITLSRETTGERLLRLRLARGWTQAELGNQAGLATLTVHRAEIGLTEMTTGSLVAIADALGVSLDYLYRGVEHVGS